MSALRDVVGRTARWCVTKKKLAEFRRSGIDRPFLLIDTPEHGNIGDQAIALAEQRLLSCWFGDESYFEITASQVDGYEGEFAKLSPMNQVVLIHGGGFLGALWPNEEYRFRRILEAFSDHKVVVFPQTVTFDSVSEGGQEFLDDSRRIYMAHPDLTIFCRERRTLTFMQGAFPEVRAELVPDVVLSLETSLTNERRSGILLCMRSDIERALDDAQAAKLAEATKRMFPGVSAKWTDTVVPRQISMNRRAQEVSGKLREFSQAQLVITDRLHGMVFAAITGTPCIALNNGNGKVGAVYEWISDLPYIFFAKSVEEAVMKIESGLHEPEPYPREKFVSLLAPIYRVLGEAYGPDGAMS